VNASCNNTKGGYNCSCKDGYTGDGQNCTDINECAAQVNPCDTVSNSECENTDGSYNCQCKDGFVRNGPNCEDDVCQGFKTLDSPDRKDSYTNEIELCDHELTEGWYRFKGEAGTRMPTTCVPTGRCGASSPGWLNGNHSTVADGEVYRQVCFHTNEGCCGKYLKIRVKNCTSYYIYKLLPTEGCNLRYCGTD